MLVFFLASPFRFLSCKVNKKDYTAIGSKKNLLFEIIGKLPLSLEDGRRKEISHQFSLLSVHLH